MPIISASASGNTDKTEHFLKNMQNNTPFDDIEIWAQQGIDALEAATPHETGLAAGSWYYEITKSHGGYTISWNNSDKDSQGTPIVILVQYGHGTGTGGYVEPHDFINPATKEVFDNITDALSEAVKSA